MVLWARIGKGKGKVPCTAANFDVDAAMFLLLFLLGSDDRTGLAPGGFLKEVCKPGAFFPNVPRVFPFPRAVKLDSLATLVPARRTSTGKAALDSMLQTRPMHAAVRYNDRSDHSPHVHASCGRDFDFDSDELDLFSVRLLKAPVRLAWDYRDSRHRQ